VWQGSATHNVLASSPSWRQRGGAIPVLLAVVAALSAVSLGMSQATAADALAPAESMPLQVAPSVAQQFFAAPATPQSAVQIPPQSPPMPPVGAMTGGVVQTAGSFTAAPTGAPPGQFPPGQPHYEAAASAPASFPPVASQPVPGGPPPAPQVAAVTPPRALFTQFGGAQAAAQPDAPPANGATSIDDVMRRLEAAEAELDAMRRQLEPSEKRIKELEEINKKAAALDKPFPLVRLSGFFQYDTGWFSQDFQSKEVLGNIQNGTGFRRTRLQGLGKLSEFTSFSIEMDFAFVGRPSFMDVWGEQSNLPLLGHVRIGQYRQPVTMDSWSNIKHLEFLERSAPFIALDPFRRVGIMGWDNSEDERTMWAYSLFGTGVTFWNGASTVYNTEGNDNRFGTQIGDSGGISFSTRATHLLYYDPHANNRYLMHIGGGYLFGELGGSGTTGTFAKAFEARTIPEFFVGDQGGGFLTAAGTPNVVDSGRFLASNYQMLHAEVAGSWGPAHYQAEYMAQFVNQRGGGTVFYDGGYIQGGYFLTGENTGYNKLQGAMDYNVKPHSEFFGIGRKKWLCGWGAWELAARWSWLDLSSTKIRADNYVPGQTTFPSAVPPPIINPGVLNEPTIAVNWWWNEYMRMQFNYIHSMVNSNAGGFYATDIYGMRFQTEF